MLVHMNMLLIIIITIITVTVINSFEKTKISPQTISKMQDSVHMLAKKIFLN